MLVADVLRTDAGSHIADFLCGRDLVRFALASNRVAFGGVRSALKESFLTYVNPLTRELEARAQYIDDVAAAINILDRHRRSDEDGGAGICDGPPAFQPRGEIVFRVHESFSGLGRRCLCYEHARTADALRTQARIYRRACALAAESSLHERQRRVTVDDVYGMPFTFGQRRYADSVVVILSGRAERDGAALAAWKREVDAR